MTNKDRGMRIQPETAVTFILPGDNRSGGVRVTVLMANQLISRGYSVRIAVPKGAKSSRGRLRKAIVAVRGFHSKQTGWLHQFEGAISDFKQINDLKFVESEIVIAVGTFTLHFLNEVPEYALKLRYNHGFPAEMSAQHRALWSLAIPTITVSHTLVPELETLSGLRILGVVPNGVEHREYFDEARIRDGIGFIYNSHPNKGMDIAEEVVTRVRERLPWLPWYVFGTEKRPTFLKATEYHQYPSVDKARELYNRCKLWMLTSNTEGLPGAALEAMACGTPVVSTDNDGSKEILRHNENGSMVSIGDVNGLAREIERICTREDLQMRLANGARTTAREFTWERAAEKMESVLRSLKGLAEETSAYLESDR